MAWLESVLLRSWQHRGWLAHLLWPLSWCYGQLVRRRNRQYRTGLKRAQHLPVPVVVVGNVIVGGAGKTPVTLAVLRHLQQRGFRPAVLSRGHGGRHTGAQVLEVRSDTPALLCGDEPALIHKTTGLPVWVAPDRVAAARAALAAHPDTDVLVCDDGLQHLRLAADVAIAVFDERGTGNGWLLPAGLLREPWPLDTGRTVDLVLQAHSSTRPGCWPALPLPPACRAFSATRSLAGHAVDLQGKSWPLHELARWSRETGRPLVAWAGVAKPHAFFAMLEEQGVPLSDTVAWPDHHPYDIETCSKLFNTEKRQALIFTEKDAIKLTPLLHQLPGVQAWAVPLVMDIDPRFFAALDERLSSLDGHQTA